MTEDERAELHARIIFGAIRRDTNRASLPAHRRREYPGEWRDDTLDAARYSHSAMHYASTTGIVILSTPQSMEGAQWFGGLDFGSNDESVLSLYERGAYTTNVSNISTPPTTAEPMRVMRDVILGMVQGRGIPRECPPTPPPLPHIVGYFDIGDDVTIKDRPNNTVYVSVGEALRREFAGEDVEIVLHKCVYVEMAVAGSRAAIKNKRKTESDPDGWLRPLPPPDPLDGLRRHFNAPDAKIKTVPRDFLMVSGAIYPRVPWGSDKGDKTSFPYEPWERQLRPVSLGSGQTVFAAVSPDNRTIYVREDSNLFQVGREEF